MTTRIVSLVVLAAFLNLTISCTRSVRVFKEELPRAEEKITDVVLTTGEAIKFGPLGGRYSLLHEKIVGFTEYGEYVMIDIDDILYVRVSRVDPVLTIVTTVGVIAVFVGAVFLIALLTKESCPFVYSYDGEKYIFDAEPLGGAICLGLKKNDYSRLEHLKPVDGKYRLLLRNEVEETQYTDEIKLLVVDHPLDSEVIPDTAGNIYTVEKPVVPILAVDENGKDLMKFVKERDQIAWQTKLPTDDSFRGRDLRHQLTFEFPKPPDASSAKLIVNAGTALWGSNMIREMLQLRGNRVNAWYQAVNKGEPELMELIQFIEREELYALKIYIKEGESWVQHGFIPGGGPLITEDRVIHLDLSSVPGNKLIVRLNPPMGFWSIDYIGIEYGNYPDPEITEVPLASAEDLYGKDITGLLRENDNLYHVMPRVGDWSKLSFEVPPQREGMKRSIFLQASGYYKIHLSKDRPEQTELISHLLMTPGAIVEFALDKYLEWHSELLNSNQEIR